MTNASMVDLTVIAAFSCAVVRTLGSIAHDVDSEFQTCLRCFPLPA